MNKRIRRVAAGLPLLFACLLWAVPALAQSVDEGYSLHSTDAFEW